MKVSRVVICAASGVCISMAGVIGVHADRLEDIDNVPVPGSQLSLKIVQTPRECATGFAVPVWKDQTTRPIGVVCVPPAAQGD